MQKKKINPIAIKGIARKGLNRYINFNPTDDPKDRFKSICENLLTEQPVTVKAKSSRTGRTIVKHFRTPEDAAKHYHKWLTSGKLRNVQLATEALQNKSNNYDISYNILAEVFDRGLNDWSTDKPLTQEQWAFARVNSFIQGGKALELDEDLISEAREYRITARTSNKSLGRLAKRKDAIGRQAKQELKRRLELAASQKFKNKGTAKKKLENVLQGKTQINTTVAKKIINTLGLNPKSAIAKSLTAVAFKHEEDRNLQKQVNKHVQSAEFKKQQRIQTRQLKQKELEDAKAKEEKKRMKKIIAAIDVKLDSKIAPIVSKIEKKELPPEPIKLIPKEPTTSSVTKLAAEIARNNEKIALFKSREELKKALPPPMPDLGDSDINKPKKSLLAKVGQFFNRKKSNLKILSDKDMEETLKKIKNGEYDQ